jgi:DNA helicase HerA-like ATPase
MEATFEQLSLIARRGRKRWLSLMFITQSPEHMPSEVLGLVNNLIVHKLSPDVAKGLSGAVSGIDSSLWKRVATLAPGQALVHCAHMARPLLVAVDPAPCKLRMVT